MKIMVGYHGFEPEGHLEAAVIRQAEAFNAKVVLVTSVKIGEDVPKEAFDLAEANLEKGKAFLSQKGVDCSTVLLETGLSKGEDLLKYAKDNQIDEIIIGVRSRSKLGKLIFGSTAQYIILNARCPVLSISEKQT